MRTDRSSEVIDRSSNTASSVDPDSKVGDSHSFLAYSRVQIVESDMKRERHHHEAFNCCGSLHSAAVYSCRE